MAPVKRATASAVRETRSTRGSTVAKKKTVTLNKKSAAPATEDIAQPTKSTATARKGRKKVEESTSEQDHELEATTKDMASVSEQRSTRGRTTKTVPPKAVPNTTRSLAAAPRRKIKVTPINTSQAPTEDQTAESASTKTKTKSSTDTKKIATRSRRAVENIECKDPDQSMQEDIVTEAAKTRSTRKTSSRTASEQSSQDVVVAKARGRPKKMENKDKEETGKDDVSSSGIRATRVTRAGSSAVQDAELAETNPQIQVTKAGANARKKVTFQDPPKEDDKENQPIPSKSKKANTTKQDTKSAAGTGLRAKPLRKTTTRKTVKASSSNKDQEPLERKMPRALTPKKITQVAKSGNSEEDEDASDGEDELNGGKTPIRDLATSPRRPLTVEIARALSPAKKLDFTQRLVPNSMTGQLSELVVNHSLDGSLGSPARRQPASPFKDSLRDSPKRGDGSRLLFPTGGQKQSDAHTSIASKSMNTISAIQNTGALLQSPKRSGILDGVIFPQAAVKQSTKTSPFKASLLGSPARRLFSPLKKANAPKTSKITETATESGINQSDEEQDQKVYSDTVESSIAVTSHFRASTSPMRLFRVESEHGNVDFDESVLQIRSPPKVRQSPLKKTPQHFSKEAQAHQSKAAISPSLVEITHEPVNQDFERSASDIDPTQLDLAQQACSERQENGSMIDDPVSADVQSTDDSSARGASTARSGERSSMLQTLFRSTEPRDESEDESEDELSPDKVTPRFVMKPRASQPRRSTKPRESFGLSQSAARQDFGFTPLAVQMSSWLAASPEMSGKHFTPRTVGLQRCGSFEYTPLAGQHIEGEVVISRNSTPVQKLNMRKSMLSNASARSTAKDKRLLGLRKPTDSRQSLGMPVHEDTGLDTPIRSTEFDEYMEIRDMETGDDSEEGQSGLHNNDLRDDFDQIMHEEVDTEAPGIKRDDYDLVDERSPEDDTLQDQSGEFTTDLVRFTHATETAMVDFEKLAQEADELALKPSETSMIADGDVLSDMIIDVKEQDRGDAHNGDNLEHDDVYSVPVAINSDNIDRHSSMAIEDVFRESHVSNKLKSPLLHPAGTSMDSPSLLVLDRDNILSSSPAMRLCEETTPAKHSTTPVRTLMDFNRPRIINTVVSKVPLKPEGEVSPIKMKKKRAHSFGDGDGSPAKRLSINTLRQFSVSGEDKNLQSPDRRMRTSVAPSPGGTSTPASKYSRHSLGDSSTLTTPGEMSFAVDDFGDSTLDGIEIPEDYENTAPQHLDAASTTPATVENNEQAEPLIQTLKQSTSHVTTPATIKQSSARSVKKTPNRRSTNGLSERTPLEPVGKGVLHGAIVYVDVHTSEGADASGIFVELLTQMGARCVKEWRWNPRASLAPRIEIEDVEQRIGITHVVYKDGGKRTLEKVRDAKGEVWCVGVSWVLDCERQSKWLDEASYAIDTTIMPRGGSKRRKSMEPRALMLSGDGSVSTNKNRRSVSAEMSELMKRELVNTPARGQEGQASPAREEDDDDDEDDELQGQSTPTGFVSYDPRTAMTPGTPYLVGQGKKLIQMSAPPKQTGKRLFTADDEEKEYEDDNTITRTKGNEAVIKDAKKFRMKNLDMKTRRRTLGFKPAVGSPLAKN